jgi:hypothetical protein
MPAARRRSRFDAASAGLTQRTAPPCEAIEGQHPAKNGCERGHDGTGRRSAISRKPSAAAKQKGGDQENRNHGQPGGEPGLTFRRSHRTVAQGEFSLKPVPFERCRAMGAQRRQTMAKFGEGALHGRALRSTDVVHPAQRVEPPRPDEPNHGQRRRGRKAPAPIDGQGI